MSEAKENEILWCKFCGGSGRYGLNKEKICPACGGVGKFLAPDKWVWCSCCRGSGVDPRTPNTETQKRPCPACGGKGRIRPREV